MTLVVGVDVGTQSLKAVACDEGLAVRGAHQVGYTVDHPHPGWAEQPVARWEAALGPAIAGALERAGRAPGDVAALALAGQLDGCVAVDAAGRALAPALIWQDRRAVAEAGLAPAARVFAVAGQVADPSHLAAKARWLRDRGVAAARWHQPVGYLVERLTGRAVIDPALASTTMLYDLAAGGWSGELLAAFGLDEAALPALLPATAVAGALHARGAALAGLPVGCPVAVGTGDDFATPLGAGLVRPGPVACAVGTAEVVGALAAAAVRDAAAAPMVETHAYPAGGFFVENPGWLAGGAVRWAAALLGLGAEPDADAALDALAAAAPPGADGVVFVPALAGAMTPTWRPHARGALYGLAAGHDRRHVARAVLEGLAFACRDVVERLAGLGLATDEVLLLGGGARSAVWAQLRADALGRPHRVAARTDTCAVGAAMLAAVAVGAAPDLRAAAGRLAPAERVFLPTGAHASLTSSAGGAVGRDRRADRPSWTGAGTEDPRGAYDEAYDRYRRVVAQLDPLGDAPWR